MAASASQTCPVASKAKTRPVSLPALRAAAAQQLGDAVARVGDAEARQASPVCIDDHRLMLARREIDADDDIVASGAQLLCSHRSTSWWLPTHREQTTKEHELRLSCADPSSIGAYSTTDPSSSPRRCASWLGELGVTTLFIEPASPWENGYVESFNGKLRDELLNGEIFSTLKEAQILMADWRRLHNGLRPHSSLGQRPPAPETIVFPGFSLSDFAPPRPMPEVTLGLA